MSETTDWRPVMRGVLPCSILRDDESLPSWWDARTERQRHHPSRSDASLLHLGRRLNVAMGLPRHDPIPSLLDWSPRSLRRERL